MALRHVQPILNYQSSSFTTAFAPGEGQLVSFKVNTKDNKTDTEYLKKKLENWGVWENQSPECYFPNKDVVEPNPTWIAKKLNI
jgi:hypothetical protein